MSKVKSSPEKKRLAYARDHVTPAEYPHAFRKNWPKTKAKAERAARHKARQVLEATWDDAVVGMIRRKRVRKWGSISLHECVRFKQWKRQEMLGAHKARRSQRGQPQIGAVSEPVRR
jgi:hypothetical protein